MSHCEESHYQNDFEITKMVSVAKPFKIETHVQVLPEFHFGGSLGNSFLLKQLLERFFFLRVLGIFSLNFEKKRDSCSLATISNLSNGNFYDVIMAAKPLCDAVLFLWRSIMVCSPFKEKKNKKETQNIHDSGCGHVGGLSNTNCGVINLPALPIVADSCVAFQSHRNNIRHISALSTRKKLIRGNMTHSNVYHI